MCQMLCKLSCYNVFGCTHRHTDTQTHGRTGQNHYASGHTMLDRGIKGSTGNGMGSDSSREPKPKWGFSPVSVMAGYDCISLTNFWISLWMLTVDRHASSSWSSALVFLFNVVGHMTTLCGLYVAHRLSFVHHRYAVTLKKWSVKQTIK